MINEEELIVSGYHRNIATSDYCNYPDFNNSLSMTFLKYDLSSMNITMVKSYGTPYLYVIQTNGSGAAGYDYSGNSLFLEQTEDRNKLFATTVLRSHNTGDPYSALLDLDASNLNLNNVQGMSTQSGNEIYSPHITSIGNSSKLGISSFFGIGNKNILSFNIDVTNPYINVPAFNISDANNGISSNHGIYWNFSTIGDDNIIHNSVASGINRQPAVSRNAVYHSAADIVNFIGLCEEDEEVTFNEICYIENYIQYGGEYSSINSNGNITITFFVAIGENYECVNGTGASFRKKRIVDEITPSYDFTAYPNPSTGEFQLNISSDVLTTYKLNVRNTLGQTVYSTQVQVNGTKIERMDLSGLEKGVYFVSLENESEKLLKKVVLK